MWINNTATTAMMVPIVDAMLEELGINTRITCIIVTSAVKITSKSVN